MRWFSILSSITPDCNSIIIVRAKIDWSIFYFFSFDSRPIEYCILSVSCMILGFQIDASIILWVIFFRKSLKRRRNDFGFKQPKISHSFLHQYFVLFEGNIVVVVEFNIPNSYLKVFLTDIISLILVFANFHLYFYCLKSAIRRNFEKYKNHFQ